MNTNSTTSRSKKPRKKPRKKVKSMEERIAALETAVASLTEWRERQDRED